MTQETYNDLLRIAKQIRRATYFGDYNDQNLLDKFNYILDNFETIQDSLLNVQDNNYYIVIDAAEEIKWTIKYTTE